MEQQIINNKVYQCRGCRSRVRTDIYPSVCKICGSDEWAFLYYTRK